MDINLQKSELKTKLKKLNLKDLIIFLIPFLIFFYYLYVYTPGILTVDSFNQLHQIATNNFNNWHPFFHTFIEMICLKIFASPISIALLQIFTFSTMWMIICKYTRNEDNENNTQFILQAVFTAIISLIPINAVYAVTLWKDILFSYFLMFSCFLIKVMIDKKNNLSLPFIIIFSLTMAITSQLRHNGIFIVLIMLIVIFVYHYKRNKPQKIHIILPALTLIFILLFASLNVAYDVEDTKKDVVFAQTMHLLADYDLNISMSNQDKEKIHKVINENTIKERYNIYYSDPICYASNEKIFDNDKGTYIGMAISYSLKNPLHFIGYLFESSSMVWDITRDANWKGQVYYINENGANIEGAKNLFYTNNKTSPETSYENVSNVNLGTNQFNSLNSIVVNCKNNPVLDTLFNSPALYMYLALLTLAGIYLITKSKLIGLVYLPNMINILIVFLSTPIQDNRYLYANLLVFYLLIMILIGTIYKQKYALNKPKDNEFKESEEEYFRDIENQIDNLTYNDISHILNENNHEIERKETPEEMEKRIRAEILREMEFEKQNKR